MTISDPRSARRLVRDLPRLLLVAMVVGVFIFPVYWVFQTALIPRSDLLSETLRLVPTAISFDAYRQVLSSEFMVAIRNSIIIASATSVLTVAISLPAAYSFSRRRFPYRRGLLMLVLFSQLFPFIILVTPIFFLYSQLGLINSRPGLVLLYTSTTVPFSTYMLLGYLDNVPVDIDEAAEVDGASTFAIIRRVILPVAWPGVAAVAFFAFARSWEEFLFALTLITDSGKATMPVALSQLFGQYTTDWNVVMAASAIAALPTLLVFLILQRHLVENLAAGSVK